MRKPVELTPADYSDILEVLSDPEFRANFARLHFLHFALKLFAQRNFPKLLDFKKDWLRTLNLRDELRNLITTALTKQKKYVRRIDNLLDSILNNNTEKLYKDFIFALQDATVTNEASLLLLLNGSILDTLLKITINPAHYRDARSHIAISNLLDRRSELCLLFGNLEKTGVMNSHNALEQTYTLLRAQGIDTLNLKNWKSVFSVAHLLVPVILSSYTSYILSSALFSAMEEQSPQDIFAFQALSFVGGLIYTLSANIIAVLANLSLSSLLFTVNTGSLPLNFDSFIMLFTRSCITSYLSLLLFDTGGRYRAEKNLEIGPCKDFTTYLGTHGINTKELERLYPASSPQQTGPRTRPFNDDRAQLPETETVTLQTLPRRVKNEGPSAVVQEEAPDAGQAKRAASADIIYKGKIYHPDPAQPHIANCEDGSYLINLRQQNRATQHWVLHDPSLLQKNCGLKDFEITRLARASQYQDGLFAKSRFGSNGFILMDPKEDGADENHLLKFKLPGSRLFSGAWPVYQQTQVGNLTIHTPDHNFKH